MKIYHKYNFIDNKMTCVIYITYPLNSEFGLDFDSIRKKAIQLSEKVRKYILDISNNISDEKVLIVLNGIVIGTLILTNISYGKNIDNINLNNESIVEVDDKIEKNDVNKIENKNSTLDQTKNLQANNKINEDIKNNKQNTKENEYDITNNPNVVNKNNTINTTPSNSNIINNSNNTRPITKPSTSPIQNSSTTNNTPNTTSKPNNPPPTQNNNSSNNNNNNNNNSINSGQKVNLKLNNGNIISIDLEEYIIGVVGAEMPASFSLEALKAQAVAARTYAMDKVSLSQTLTATTSSQCYKTNDELKNIWKNDFSMYYEKVKNAVTATKGQVIKYNDKYIDAVYFSMSNGKTEDAQNVWGNSFSYLKSVDSPFDANLAKTTQEKILAKSYVSSKLGVKINSILDINIISKTIGNRVKIINISGKEFTGTDIRSKLELRSADFTITEAGDNLIFTTKGYGHGVGMSQYGANEMGKLGYTYKQILTHYYTGVTISTL